jgi:hypothetical protein
MALAKPTAIATLKKPRKEQRDWNSRPIQSEVLDETLLDVE